MFKRSEGAKKEQLDSVIISSSPFTICLRRKFRTITYCDFFKEIMQSTANVSELLQQVAG
jgi:hypothetical protein